MIASRKGSLLEPASDKTYCATELSRSKGLGVYFELTRPRLSFLVVFTTAFGFYMAPEGALSPLLLFHTVAATALLAAGAAVLNQWTERELDARMRRTRQRPMPSGRMSPERALSFGVSLSVFGIVYLAAAAGVLTCALGALTLVSYLFVYTPMKLRSSVSTLLGAVPGALPPVMGWTAASGGIDAGAGVLFMILFLWQLPHFLSIGWLYREDYARAGMPMLSVFDPDGLQTARQSVLYSLVLIPVTLQATRLGIAGWGYFFGVLALGILYFGLCVVFAWRRDSFWAKRLFLGSIAYLPFLMGLMVWDKI